MSRIRLPPPSWPVWIVFGVLIVPGVIVLCLLGGAKDTATDRLAFTQDAAGRSIVVTGELTDVETSSGLPNATGQYTATIPDADGGRGETVTLAGDQHWGFPPSTDFPAEVDFLVVQGDPPRGVDHGPVGSLRAVTDIDVQDAEAGLATTQTVWVVGIVLFWVVMLGLPALAIVLAVRRRRARRPARADAASIAPMPRI